MAYCIVSMVADADVPMDVLGLPLWASCVVHTHRAPCPRDGEPANPLPLHAWDQQTTRAEEVAHWAAKTGQQRPLVLHHGHPADAEAHVVSEDCWCGPEWIPAVA